jgi:hypothetical protein
VGEVLGEYFDLREEVTGRQTNNHRELYNLYSSPNIIRVMSWPGCVGQWYSTFFPPVPLETLFHSTLYPQSCWCIIQVIHNYI